MNKSLALLSLCAVVPSAFALPDYDPFSNATTAGGTAYAVGSPLAGQTNANGQSWFAAGTGTIQPTIVSGDLSVPGLFSSGGGASAAFSGNGNNARLNLSVGAGGITTGTVYYSFALQMTSLTGLTTSGVFFAGLNNTQGAQTTAPNTLASRVVVRSAGAGLYNIGLDKASGTAASFVWSPGNYSTSDTLFLVGSYTFNTSTTTDDLSQLWVDPDLSTFGAAAAPGGSLSSTAGTDLARIASFVLYDRSTEGGTIDDLRFGLNWSDVTPPVPEPTTISLGMLGVAGLGLRRWLRKK